MTQTIPAWSSSRSLIHQDLNRLLSKILPRYARGVVVDLGCGAKPYQSFTRAKNYIGVDKQGGDISADILNLPLKNNFADAVICTQVLEHVNDPRRLFQESGRILKTNGYLVLTAPMVWPLHEEPNDYWRFTEFGLKHLAKEAGFKVIRCQPMGGFISGLWQTTAILLERPTYHRGWLRTIYKLMLKIVFALVQPLVYKLDRIKPVSGLTMNYLLLAKKI